MKAIRVLIVDDEKDFCLTFQEYLKKKGIWAEVAFDGDCARHLMENNLYDFIFFDFNMPGIPGIELPELIAQHNPAAKKILVSGYDLVEDKFKNILELDALFKKPVKLTELYSFITDEVKKKK